MVEKKKEEIEIHFARIDRTEETKKLYQLEEERNEKIKECAKEWSRLFNIPEKRFWNRAIPQALFDLLTSFSSETSKKVCETYLELEKVGLV